MIDIERSHGFFNPRDYTKEINIIGAGATGSMVAYQLACYGLDNIHVWDYDVVESHNVNNQIYFLDNIGQLKVDALKDIIIHKTGTSIHTHNVKVTETEMSSMEGSIFVLVDKMDARKEFFLAKKLSTNVDSWIETRLDPRFSLLYNVDITSPTCCNKYEKTLYSDAESSAFLSACGSEITVLSAVMILSSYAVLEWIKNISKNESLELDKFIGETIFNFTPVLYLQQNPY